MFSEEQSPEKPIQLSNKYQLTPTLLPITPTRKLQDVHSYYSKQNISPLLNEDEEQFEDLEDLQDMYSKSSDCQLLTGLNTCPALTDNRRKSEEQIQLSQYMFYYKSSQKISIPRASIFKIQHLTQNKLKQSNINLPQIKQIQE
ncbi:unnamed protein product (macronuclear) [Paramecium tetraurelia]|uniref:Uncharacterized protein n=1 Tax=Paramecium tetraurelia TaxID=5888 RepID=A0DGR4_PARTE|nr:uncharacterized protein GSPATT00002360001 [Paramecium tetraurelia]CAK82231.1 unnamed protein product [Paramecium tetraurelia]|eukprot:XP_001449628.1 hypothetical protein (macronuclear) [Paramecium tetraurelia strain d4-2]